MRKEDKKKLTSNRPYIVKNLIDLENVLDHLIAKQVFTPLTRERIVYESRVPSDRIRHTIDLLIKKGPDSYKKFLETLIITGNAHVAQQLDKDYCNSDECKQYVECDYDIDKAKMASQQQGITQQRQSRYHSSTAARINRNQCGPIRNSHHRPKSHMPTSISMPTTPIPMTQPILNVNTVSSTLTLKMHHTQLAADAHSTRIRSSSLSPAHIKQYPITVASCQVVKSPPSPLAYRAAAAAWTTQSNRTGTPTIGGHHTPRDYSNDDTISLMSHESLIPTASVNDDHDDDDHGGQIQYSPNDYQCDDDDGGDGDGGGLNWDIINNFDLDFSVLSNDEDGDSYCLNKKRYTQSENNYYRMDSVPRGVCLLINNEHFYGGHNQEEMLDLRRYGTDMDASRLKNLFEKLKFTVNFKCDLTEADIRDEIRAFALDCEINGHAYDAIALIILSHGVDGYLNGTDYDNKINIDKDVLNMFDDVLIGKPKLFIFQACRGENFNQKSSTRPVSFSIEETVNRFENLKMTHRSSHMGNLRKAPIIHQSTSIFNFTDGRPIRTSLPSRSDFFIWYSSVRGFVSHRDTDGSPFLKCLVAVFSTYAKTLELTEMVQKVNQLMQQYEKRHFHGPNSVSSFLMLPVAEYLLTKKLYFNP